MSLRSLQVHWERVYAGFALLGAAQMLLAGWWGANDSTMLAEEFPYLISGGLGSAVLVAAACTLWLSGDLMDEWNKLAELDETLVREDIHAPEMPGAAGPMPWTIPQVLFAISSTGIGALLVTIGWFGASGQSRPSDQLGWFALAVCGVGAQGVGVGAHLLNGRRSIGSRLEVLQFSIWNGERVPALAAGVDTPRAGADSLVAGATMTRFHRPACPLVQRKAVATEPLRRHVERGRRACAVCAPVSSVADVDDAVGEQEAVLEILEGVT